MTALLIVLATLPPVEAAPEETQPERQTLSKTWDETAAWLDKKGISVGLGLVADWSANMEGGLSTSRKALRTLTSVSLEVDTEKLFSWNGGTFFLDIQRADGRNGTDELVGDWQGFSNIDEEDWTSVYELWFEQHLLPDILRIKLGKIDANSEFAFVDYGAEFINSSMGFTPTILGFPTYPDPSTGIGLFGTHPEGGFLSLGLFDGATQNPNYERTGLRGPRTFWGKPSDLFLVAEAGWSWESESPSSGRIGIGAWHHTGDFADWDGNNKDDTTGAYLVFDQTLWSGDAQEAGMFLQLGWADPDVAEADRHFGGGLTLKGLIPDRPEDVTGLGVSTVHFSRDARDAGAFSKRHETAVEVFHKITVSEGLSLKPDFQYIFHPGGNDLDDAFVFTFRLEMEF